MEKQPCVYILASGKRGYIYIGVTSNLPQRIYQHKSGAVNGFAKQRNCKHLVHFEMFEDMPNAIAREKQLKNWHRDWKMNLIGESNPNWDDMSISLGISE